MDEQEKSQVRKNIIAKMSGMAAGHVRQVYGDPGGGDPERLFALAVDAMYAYVLLISPEADDPGPGVALFAKAGLTPVEAAVTALQENMDIKDEDPSALPLNGWWMFRVADDDKEDGK